MNPKPPNKKEKKEHDTNIIQNPWKGVALVAVVLFSALNQGDFE